jgi:hypothetical protein
MKTLIALIVYCLIGASAATGAISSWKHQCGTELPGTAIVLVIALWPYFVPWAAMKGSAPLWDCDHQTVSP